jgi:hypothetical protein
VVAEIDSARNDGGSARLLFVGGGAGHQGTHRAV